MAFRQVSFALISYCYVIHSVTAIINLQNVFDLTWPYSAETIHWPNTRSFEFTKKVGAFREDGMWYAYNEFCLGEHGGTHLDAPYHFNEQGWKVGDIPLSHLIAPGVVVDLTKEVANHHDRTVLLPKHLDDWVLKHGPLPAKCIMLIRFGWSQYYGNKTVYLGVDDENNLNFPGISSDAAKWIADSGKVLGVGLDTASLDPGRSSNFSAHQILNGNLLYGLENVNIPKDVPESGFVLFVMPMKIKEGTGGPVRIIAILNEDTEN